jgi:hypothetical protein
LLLVECIKLHQSAIRWVLTYILHYCTGYTTGFLYGARKKFCKPSLISTYTECILHINKVYLSSNGLHWKDMLWIYYYYYYYYYYY